MTSFRSFTDGSGLGVLLYLVVFLLFFIPAIYAKFNHLSSINFSTELPKTPVRRYGIPVFVITETGRFTGRYLGSYLAPGTPVTRCVSSGSPVAVCSVHGDGIEIQSSKIRIT